MLYLAQHHVIEPGTSWWWGGLGILLIQIVVALQIGKKSGEVGRQRFEQSWGLLLLLVFIGMNAYRLYKGVWHISDSLPLQMCAISHLLAIAALLFRQKWAFLPLLFWGLAGGLHSFLTPEVTLGNNTFFISEYYFTHASIIAAPLYLVWVNGHRISRWSWFKAFWLNNLVLIPIGLVNMFLDANYMYLSTKPLADNPLIMGDWPWYILGFEFAALLHYVALSYIFRSHWVKA